MMRTLYVRTVDRKGITRTLWDANNLVISENEQGYLQATFMLNRPSDRSYDDIGLNFRTQVHSKTGQEAWVGRFETPTRNYEAGKGAMGIGCTGLGDWVQLANQRNSGIPIPSQNKPEFLIQWLFDNGYMPDIAGLDLVDSGLSGTNAYQWHANSPSDMPIGQQVQAIIAKYGTASGQRMIPYIRDGRILRTKLLPAVPTARYIIRGAFVKKLSLERRLSLVATRVRVWYPTGASTKALTTVDDTDSQNALGMDYGAGFVPFVHEATLDLTQSTVNDGSGATATAAITALRAQAMGQTKLNTVKEPQATGQIEVTSGWGVFDVVKGQEIPLYEVHCAEWVRALGVLPRPTDGSSSAAGGDISVANLMYITQKEYKLDRQQQPDGSWREIETLTLTPEVSNELATLLN